MPLMGLPPFPWGVPARVPECGAVPRNLFPKFVPKSNAGPLLLGAFADWVGNRLSLYLMEAGTDKGQDPLEIRAFRQKESTATLIHIVSKLRCFFGCGGRIRTYDLWVMSPTSYRTAPLRDMNL